MNPPAESFFLIARYLDEAALDVGGPPPDFLSHSHGEGFLKFFHNRTQRRGIYIFDEPESALSPARQIDFMKILQRIASTGRGQVIMATHSPLLMALPGVQLLQLSKFGLSSVQLKDVKNFILFKEFYADPKGFIEMMLDD